MWRSQPTVADLDCRRIARSLFPPTQIGGLLDRRRYAWCARAAWLVAIDRTHRSTPRIAAIAPSTRTPTVEGRAEHLKLCLQVTRRDSGGRAHREAIEGGEGLSGHEWAPIGEHENVVRRRMRFVRSAITAKRDEGSNETWPPTSSQASAGTDGQTETSSKRPLGEKPKSLNGRPSQFSMRLPARFGNCRLYRTDPCVATVRGGVDSEAAPPLRGHRNGRGCNGRQREQFRS